MEASRPCRIHLHRTVLATNVLSESHRHARPLANVNGKVVIRSYAGGKVLREEYTTSCAICMCYGVISMCDDVMPSFCLSAHSPGCESRGVRHASTLFHAAATCLEHVVGYPHGSLKAVVPVAKSTLKSTTLMVYMLDVVDGSLRAVA